MLKSNENEVSSGSESVVSLEQVSQLFSLPLSDAADFLGVSTATLKTICYENGLLRWPYRKFLAGKTIDQIKRDAIAQKTNLPIREISKSNNLEHPQSQGSNSSLPANMLTSNLTTLSDEFKYGFPSDGLSTISFRWWENSHCPKGTQNPDKTASFGGNDEIPSRTASLSDLRNKAVKEGKAALRLGVYKGHGIGKLDTNKRSTLTQIFKSSLPSQWEEHGLS